MKLVSSRDNPLYKSLVALAGSARERREKGRTLLEGIHLVTEYRDARGLPELVLVSESGRGHGEIRALLESLDGAQVVMFPDRMFERVAQVSAPVGIAAVIPIIVPGPGPDPALGVLLEDIQDPGNVGTILRCAAAAGAQAAWLSRGCADPWSPRVLRAAMGAHFRLPVHAGANLITVAREFRGRVVAALPRAGRSLYECRLTGPLALVLGSEGSGVSAALLAEADETVFIPMAPGAESLNAAAAAAVCLFEAVRQRSVESRESRV
ncbi:MAG TPA: RNA methyltransferase [Burkholderiales bacterium]